MYVLFLIVEIRKCWLVGYNSEIINLLILIKCV